MPEFIHLETQGMVLKKATCKSRKLKQYYELGLWEIKRNEIDYLYALIILKRKYLDSPKIKS